MSLIDVWNGARAFDGLSQSVIRGFAQSGLTMSEGQIAELNERRLSALRELGRFELGEGVLPDIVERLALSPYVQQSSLTDDLAQLQDAFYRLRDEVPTDVPDDDILDALFLRYGECGGSTGHACAMDGRDIESMVAASLEDPQRMASEGGPLPPLIDEQGLAYQRLRSQWDCGERCAGWDGEAWHEGEDR